MRGLELDESSLQEMALEMMRADDGAMYPLDLYAHGAINRTFALSRGFRSLILDFNFLCAGAILRLQLDTAIRFHAAYLAPQAYDFAAAVVEGTEVRKLKDRKH
jgi:hypothetical protein